MLRGKCDVAIATKHGRWLLGRTIMKLPWPWRDAADVQVLGVRNNERDGTCLPCGWMGVFISMGALVCHASKTDQIRSDDSQRRGRTAKPVDRYINCAFSPDAGPRCHEMRYPDWCPRSQAPAESMRVFIMLHHTKQNFYEDMPSYDYHPMRIKNHILYKHTSHR
jgi:hypothetical protein